MNDYRVDKFKNIDFSHIRDKKNNFMTMFRTNHKTAKRIYNFVGRSKDYHNSFKDTYESRCVYCGADYSFLNRLNFDIDHYIPQDSNYNLNYLHGISNLAYSCRSCNAKKLAFCSSKLENQILLHPDNNYYPDLFYRNSSFKICINDSYKSNQDVVTFYKQLELGNNEKRLLYLIMLLNDFLEEKPINEKEKKARKILELAKEKFNSNNFN